MTDSVEPILDYLRANLPTSDGWTRTSQRSRYRNTLARWCALAYAQMTGSWRDADYYDGYSVNELNKTVIDYVAASANKAVGYKILVPDFEQLAESIKAGGTDVDTWLTDRNNAWVAVGATDWEHAPGKLNFLNPGPEAHYDKLRAWYHRHWHLYQLAQSDQYSQYAAHNGLGWITSVDWREWLRRYNANPRRHSTSPRTLIRQANSMMSSLRNMIDQETRHMRDKGFDPDDPDVYDKVERYVIDLRFLRDNNWTDPDPAWFQVSGDPSKGTEKPLAEVARESAAKMKEVLATAKQDANFMPAPMPGGLIEVQFPIYDRQQKGYRILNRVWSPQQRLAFVKHTLDTMSGIPIKAQELDILSASGLPVPRDAVTLDYEVAWRCPLTGLFHDPADAYFINDLHACQGNWTANGNVVNANVQDDEWYLAHRPWTVMSAEYADHDRYWSIMVPPGFHAQQYRG
jgi:hypothetical protein